MIKPDPKRFAAISGKVVPLLAAIDAVVKRTPDINPDSLKEVIVPLARAGEELIDAMVDGLDRPEISQDLARTCERDAEEISNNLAREIAFDRMLKAVDSAESYADKAEAAVKKTRSALGEEGSLNLAEHFQSYQRTERRSAEALRGFAVALAIVAVVVLALLPHEDLSIADVLQRALIAIPAFGLAGYLAAEAARHRRAWQWAATLKVQLLTIDDYVQPLDATDAVEIRQLLAKRAFGELPTVAAGDTTDASPDAVMPIGVASIVEKVLTELKPKPGP
ncbi:hypothetical protein ACI780_20845 [Geodermatophilus sp. SYSU D00814]